MGSEPGRTDPANAGSGGRVSAVIRATRPLLLALTAVLTLAACGDASSSAKVSGGLSSATLPKGCAAADGSSARKDKFDSAPPMCLQDGKQYIATIETTGGTLHVLMRPDIAPNTVNSFVNLARYHYFDGTTCRRAIRNFVVQCGDPTATGHGGPGYEFPDELSKIEPYRIGSVAMANSGADTNGSQFFIITGDDGAALPARYTLFGIVDDNDLGVVATLDGMSNTQDGPPLQPIDISKVTIDER